jgi:hypothetical protein
LGDPGAARQGIETPSTLIPFSSMGFKKASLKGNEQSGKQPQFDQIGSMARIQLFHYRFS